MLTDKDIDHYQKIVVALSESIGIMAEIDELIEALLNAGANAKAKDKKGESAFDHAKENENLYNTKTYWKLNDAQYK